MLACESSGYSAPSVSKIQALPAKIQTIIYRSELYLTLYPHHQIVEIFNNVT